jgi:uncharacterized protein
VDLLEETRAYSILIDQIGDPPDTVDFADDWCKGYVAGIALREDEWKPAMDAAELTKAFVPILLLGYPKGPATPNPFDNPDQYAAMIRSLPQSAVDIYDWWRTPRTIHRSAPKVSANEPCPCGSGKKYKRCCSPLRAV